MADLLDEYSKTLGPMPLETFDFTIPVNSEISHITFTCSIVNGNVDITWYSNGKICHSPNSYDKSEVTAALREGTWKPV